MKQTELHRHLDVSTRTSTLLELCQREGLEAQSTSLDRFKEKIYLSRPLGDLNEVLDQFGLFQKVLQTPADFERTIEEVIEDCYLEGTRKLELRYSPSFVCAENKLTWDETLESYEVGLKKACKRFPDLQVGLICIATREFGYDLVAETVEFFLKNSKRFIGFDLAGKEKSFPARDFEPLFKRIKEEGQKITVHAGEGEGPESVWEALDLLKADRIGHGVRSIEDPELMDVLKERKICLENCPTSNWITGIYSDLKEHPLPHFISYEIPVSINTDDPGVFNVTLKSEMDVCRNKMGLSEDQISFCMRSAEENSFLR